MILALKIAVLILGLLLFAGFIFLLFSLVVAIGFDNEKCQNCPMKDKCIETVMLGHPSLCNNSDPLYPHKL